MAKKTKPRKRAKRKAFRAVIPIVFGDDGEFEFADAVLKEAETVRRLAHRAVDLVVDSGCHKFLCACVNDRLAFVARNQSIKSMTDFIEEACAQHKEVPRG